MSNRSVAHLYIRIYKGGDFINRLYELFFMKKRIGRKGALDSMALTIVNVIVIMFVGLFLISKVSSLQSQSELYDYSYTEVTNTSELGLITSTSDTTVNFTTPVLASTISGETDISSISCYVHNPDTTEIQVQVSFNNVVLGNITAKGSQSYNDTSNGWTQAFLSNAKNNVTFISNLGSSNVTISNVTAKYATGTSNTNIGSVYGSLSTSTGTLYDVVILVSFIFAIAIAIGMLKGIGGGGGAPSVAV